jgi:hypothetical protein
VTARPVRAADAPNIGAASLPSALDRVAPPEIVERRDHILPIVAVHAMAAEKLPRAGIRTAQGRLWFGKKPIP